MEENVYVCGWSETSDGFELWVKSPPRFRGRGRTYLEAEDALLAAIVAGGGAQHAVLEFVPPLPRGEFDQRYSDPMLYTVCGGDRSETDEPRRVMFETEEERVVRESWYDGFFDAPCCRACRTPQGPRNERRLMLTWVRSNYDAGFVVLAGASLYIFSENFLHLLSEEEKQRIRFRPVDRAGKARKKFFELIGPSGPPEVAVAGLELGGWYCETCGARKFGYWSKDSGINNFVARQDLPNPLQEIFTIGTEPNVSLCITAERWANMVGRSGTRGMISSLIGVVPDHEVVRNPELKPRQESR